MIQCSCINGYGDAFDFSIQELSKSKIIFEDVSNWMEEEGYTIPESFEINISEGSNSKNFTVKARGYTTIKAKSFGLPIFKDGIYTIKTTSCGDDYCRHTAILACAQCKVDRLSIEGQYDESIIIDLQADLDQIRNLSRMGYSDEANKLYIIVEKKLKRLSCQNC